MKRMNLHIKLVRLSQFKVQLTHRANRVILISGICRIRQRNKRMNKRKMQAMEDTRPGLQAKQQIIRPQLSQHNPQQLILTLISVTLTKIQVHSRTSRQLIQISKPKMDPLALLTLIHTTPGSSRKNQLDNTNKMSLEPVNKKGNMTRASPP